MNHEALHPSRDAANRYLSDISEALEAVREGRGPDMDAIAWPSGLDRENIFGLPISVRTRNCLLAGRLHEGASSLRVYELRQVQNFGFKGLQDLLFGLEKFLVEYVRVGATEPRTIHRRTEEAPNAVPASSVPSSTLVPSPNHWQDADVYLQPLLAAGAELYGKQSLADVLNPELLHLAEKMGIASKIDTIEISRIVGGTPGLVSLVSDQLQLILERTSETERKIIEHRLLRTPPDTLEEVGSRVGVTRERIRQVQARLEEKIRRALGLPKGLGIVASVLWEQLGHMVPENQLHRRFEELLPNAPELVNAVLRKALIDEMDFELIDGVYVDEQARGILGNLRVWARELADDAGLVHEDQLIEMLPAEEWRRFWPWLRDRSTLHGLYGMLGLRDSAKARVKAALLSIGRPATREEIGSVCDFEKSQVGAYLSNVPSVVRADKRRWGLREWIDDEYDGIVGEIIQRIEEDGGATTIERLMTELPSKFNVSPVSVRAYMQTPRFEIRNGSVSLASTSSVQLRHLDDVIHGRDENGAPYWTFVVESRYLEGYSVVGVPPEFANALGCSPDSGLGVRIENLPDCRELSLRWRLASTTGASLGYVAEPLRQLGLHPGDRARVTIKGTRSAELSAEGGDAQPSPSGEADATLARILRRRRSL